MMKPRHVAIAVVIAAIWGVNFVVIDVGLDDLPPLFFAALRFAAAAFPAVLFVRRPAISWGRLALIGLPLGAGQFGLLFIAMRMGFMPAGLSSLVVQAQALFTALFAGLMLHERPDGAADGRHGSGVRRDRADRRHARPGQPILAFVLCVAGAAMWGLGNIGLRTARVPDAFSFMVWVSVVPPLPLLALSVALEGPRADLHALAHVSAAGVGALLYIAYLSTLVGYGCWGALMHRYDAGQVAMYALLVPPFGMSAAAVFLGEPITFVDVLAAVLIVGGVGLGSVRAVRAVVRPESLRETAAWNEGNPCPDSHAVRGRTARSTSPSLERLAHHVLGEGAAGLVALGTTGEAPMLTTAERRTVIGVCRRVSDAHGTPLTVGAGTIGTDESVRQANECAEARRPAARARPLLPAPSDEGVSSTSRRSAPRPACRWSSTTSRTAAGRRCAPRPC